MASDQDPFEENVTAFLWVWPGAETLSYMRSDNIIVCRYEGFMHYGSANTMGYHVLLHQVLCASVSGEQGPDGNAVRIQ